MFRQARTNASKLLAGFLAVVMLLSMVPVGIVFNVFAAEVETYTVKLPADVSAKVTVTDDNDAAKVFTADTNENFEAVFENLDDETTYTLVVSGMELYKNYTKTGVVADAATPLEILDTDLTKKDAQTITFAEDSITKTFGDEAFAVTLSEAGSGTGAKAYSSTKETVAQINNSGIVTIVGVGTTEIKVSIAADKNYEAAEDTLTLTVEQGKNAIYFPTTEVNWNIKDVKTNELKTKDGAKGTTTFESDNDEVATVDVSTGKVTILKEGTANITANFMAVAESGYENSTASYKINASKIPDSLKYEESVINRVYGDGKETNALTKPNDVNNDLITYESSNLNVATVNTSTGEFTIVGAGTTTITATLADGDNVYAVDTASYDLVVAQVEDAISFDSPTQTYTYGDPVISNKLTVAFEELGGFNGPVTYKSSALDVVSVDSSTGTITILKSGDATITASIAEENNYKAATASYTVKVNKKTIEFVIDDETINYGDDDLDLAAQIRAGVIADLADAEKDNADIITRVVGRISYEYPTVPAGELRQAGNYEIKFTTENDDCYAFDLTGSLEVTWDWDASGLYEIEGLDGDRWGSKTNKVVIKVDSEKYRISKTHNHLDEWDDSELTFDIAEGMSGHTFYIRDIQTNGKQKISLPIEEFFGVDETNPTINKFTFKVKGNSAVNKVIYYLSFGAFCNEEVEVEVLAADPAKDANTNDVSGVESIKLYYNDQFYGSSTVDGNAAKFTLTLEQFAELKTISAIATDKVGNTPINADGEEVLTYANSENSGLGSNKWNGLLQLEQFPAEITVTYDAPTSTNGDKKWYGKDIAFNVAVSDLGDTNSGIRSVWAKINGTTVKLYDFTTSPDSTEPADNIFYFISDDRTVKVSEVSFKLDTTQVNVPTKPDGEYRIEIFACDNAGTIVKYDGTTEKAIVDTDSAKNIIVNIDRTAPKITGFDFGGDVRDDVVSIEDYGYYFKEEVKVTVSAMDEKADNELASGVDTITVVLKDKEGNYYTVNEEGAIIPIDNVKNEAVAHIATEDDFSFTMVDDFKGQIYAFATDNVGNTPIDCENTFDFDDEDIIADGDLKGYKHPNGSVLESQKKHDSAEYDHITFEKAEAMLKTNDEINNELYADNVDVTLTVTDNYSGIGKIEWSVVAPYDTGNNQEGGLVIKNDEDVAVDDVIGESGWKVLSKDKNLVTQVAQTITVDNDSNNIVVNVKLTDRAGNTTEDSIVFNIDKQAPIVTVEMNDNDDEKYDGFFNEDRTYKVTVLERNFLEENVKFVVTATDNDDKKSDVTVTPEFKVVMDGDKPKSTEIDGVEYYTYEWESKFAADADYTFSVSSVDLAENETTDAEASYVNKEGEDIRAISNVFTVDQTLPIIAISYDNNTATNEKYFAKARTATVVIKEHNFDVERVDFSAMVASLNGVKLDKQPEVKWEHLDDIHTATIAFTADADYTFDVKVTDMAANESKGADYGNSVAGKDFVVDQTIVKPVIGGITNYGSYKETVIPTISFEDVNYDSHEIRLVRTRKDQKNVDVTDEFIKGITEEAQSLSGAFDTFKKIVENDGIYTLTLKVKDKAGNEESEEYTFTVNRFGSVYVYNDKLAEVIAGGGQYVKEIAEDLVITEFNADKLLEGSLKILITRDGEPVDPIIDPAPDMNNAVNVGDSGWYEYVYTIKAETFAKDGVYKISIASEYSANDSAKNESTSVPKNSTTAAGDEITDTMTFTVDSVAPEIRNIVNLDKKIADIDKITEDGKLNVKYTVVDVGGLKLIEVYLNGKVIQTVTEEELAESAFSYTGSFDIAEQDGTKAQEVQIVVTDLAGNVTDTDSDAFLEAHAANNKENTYVFFNAVTVSRNFFVRWYANTGLFWGSIVGVIVLAGAIWFFIAAKKKKKEEEK